MSYPALGIEIARQTITVCPHEGKPLTILLEGPWHNRLAAFLDPAGGTPIAFEPTGWHYASPILAVGRFHHAVILQVQHKTSMQVRESRLGLPKNDQNDARVLALIAHEFTAGIHYAGVHLIEPSRLHLAARMRATVRAYHRATGQRVRLTNRLRHFAHSIWPTLATHLITYQRALAAGVVSPADLRQLLSYLDQGGQSDQYPDRRAIRHLRRLVEELPDIPLTSSHLRQLILETHKELLATNTTISHLSDTINALINDPHVIPFTTSWSSVPAASEPAIATLLAATNCTPHTYSEDAFKAACRLNPNVSSSGTVTRTHRTKKGMALAKGVLHLWVMRLHHPNYKPNPIHSYAEKLRLQGRRWPMQAARNKLARVLAALARSKEMCSW